MCRKCSVCNIDKGLEFFYKRKDSNSYRPYCNPCHKNYKKNLYLKKQDYYKTYCKTYREDNIELLRSKGRISYEENRSKRLESQKLSYQKHKTKRIKYITEWVSKNKKLSKSYKQKWNKNNPDLIANKSATERCRKKLRMPNWLTKEQKKEIKYFYTLAKKLSKETGIKHVVDHIVPIAGEIVSGLHVPWNLQVLDYKTNLTKSNKF